MQEASETQTWLEFCNACNYMDKETYERLYTEYEQILAMLNTLKVYTHLFVPAKGIVPGELDLG